MDHSKIRRTFPFLSHTLVAGAGWALVMTMRPPLPATTAENSSATTEARPAPTKSQVRESWQGDGGRLLRELMEKREKLDDFRDIAPASDRAAAAMAAIQAWRSNPKDAALRREACARLSHWIEADPKAAMAYWNQQAMWLGDLLSEMLVAAVANSGPTTLLACLEPSGGSHLVSLNSREMALLSLLAKALAGAGSSSQLADALKALHPPHGSVLLRQTIQEWPQAGLDQLAPLLAGSREMHVLTAYLERLSGGQQRTWLQSQFAGDVPADPTEASFLRYLVRQASALPLQERVEWMARLNHGGGRTTEMPATPENLVKEDLTYFLNRRNGNEDDLLGDWRYRLRHNQLTATEVLTEVQRALPDAAARQPDLLLRSVFQHVAQQAPEGAMELLRSLPVAEREKLMLESAFSSGGYGNPQALLDLVSTLPPHTGSVGNERFKVWIRAANPGVARYGDSYGAWVLAMPHGVERDMALSGLAAHFDADDPQASATYRAAKTLPEGWKPGQK